MKLIDFKTVPVCKFAHTYGAENYRHVLRTNANTVEITYINDGEVSVSSEGKGVETARKGDILINLFLSDLVVESEVYHSHHTVCFKGEFEVASPPPSVVRGEGNSSQIYYLIDEIIKTKSFSPESEYKCAGLFLQLLGELESLCDSGRGQSGGEFHYVRKAKKYVYDNIRSPIKQREVATFLGISPEYLCAVFKRGTGESLMRFINRMKLEGIRMLMERENTPLYRAAELYGFSDPNYVSRLYIKYYGVSITDSARFRYRKDY